MRPLELHMRNFRSFSGEVTFDFRDRTLVGIVGPIGAGKSSMLDAIAYALYARTPRVASAVRDLINQRSDTAIVRLLFDVDGDTWQVTRSIRRGQSTHTLQQLADDGSAVETITQKTDVNARVEQLIGLDFDGFTRSVLLAQGRFAEFLTAQPAQRDRVLKGVFGHERIDQMRMSAKDRSASLSLAIEKLAGRLETLALAEERLAEQRVEHTSLEDRLEVLRKIQPRVTDHDERIGAIESRLTAIEDRLSALATHGDHLPDPEDVDRGVEEMARTHTKRLDLATSLEAKRTVVTDAEATLAELVATSAGLDEAGELVADLGAARSKLDERRGRALGARKAHDALAADHQLVQSSLVTIKETVAADELRLVAAVETETGARSAVDAARHANMAHTLRGELETGEPCPVCEQPVQAIPGEVVADDVSDAEARLAAARESTTAVREAVSRSSAALTSAETKLESVDAQLSRSTEELAGFDQDIASSETAVDELETRIGALLGEGAPTELLRLRRSALTEAQEVVNTARKAAENVRAAHDQAIRDEQTASKQFADIRLAATRVASALGMELASTDDDAAALGADIAGLRTAVATEAEELGKENQALRGEHQAAATARTDLLASVEVTADLAAEIAGVGGRLEALSDQMARIEKDLASSAGDRESLAALEGERGSFDRIASDLTDAKFVRFLLDDERIRLGDLGSDHFQRLTAGRYRFSDDGKFEIIDLTTADIVRKADSLSGGETFLASLALALGLAEMVARSGGRLEAFFLDEGFGTLDPEHLHLAMEGVERLVTDGSTRLVVVVSHVAELRQRLEDLIELDKDPLTGDTIVVRA